MPEYIEREALIEKLNEAPAYFDSGDIRYGIEIAIDQTKKQPAADVVEVVRCKDCIHFSNDTDYCREHNKGYCEFDNVIKPPTYYCSYGERKEVDNGHS